MRAALIICRNCGSLKVDVNHWEDAHTAVVRCCECGHEGYLTGFTLGRVFADGKQAKDALEDAAIPSARLRRLAGEAAR